jgi:predicted nucleotidyltransferase
MVAQSIIDSVRKYLQAVNAEGIPIEQGVIFGSQVRGVSDEWSDIDLLVISKKFDHIRNRDDINLLWRIAARTDSRIEPIAVGEYQFVEDDSSAIIEIARREGQSVRIEETEEDTLNIA